MTERDSGLDGETDYPHDDAEAFIEWLRDQGRDQMAEYLEMLHEDYYNGNLTGSDRYWTLEPDGEIDVSSLVDMAVIFGWIWERDDPYDGENCEGGRDDD